MRRTREVTSIHYRRSVKRPVSPDFSRPDLRGRCPVCGSTLEVILGNQQTGARSTQACQSDSRSAISRGGRSVKFSQSITLVLVLVLSAIPLIAQTSLTVVPAPHRSYNLILPEIQLRPGVTVDLHAAVFVNESHPCNGNVAIAIHGMLHSAATWERMVASLFDDNPAGRKICRVVALDMPGHGASGLPGNFWFGALTVEDYVTAMLRALDQINAVNIRPDTVFAHSFGGLIVQLAQQRLLSQGTNLRQAYGVKDVVLLASGAPKQVPVYAIDSGMLTQTVMSFAQVDFIAGTVSISDSVWAWLFFAPNPADPSFVVPGAPTPAEVMAGHYNAPEPLAVNSALMDRPGVDAAIFAPPHGTALTLVTYQQDVVIRPEESLALYFYLTGDDTSSGFVLVPSSEAVHDTHISNPALLLQSIAAVVRVP